MEEENEMASSLYRRRKKPSMGLACCFNGHQRRSSFDVSSSSSSASILPSPRRSPSSWIRSKAVDFPEIKLGKYKNFISKIGGHRRHSSADFSYDPLSYALNFQDHDDDPSNGEDHYKSFTSRLPLSPPKIKPGTSAPSPAAGILKSSLADDEVSSRRNLKVGFDLERHGRRIHEVGPGKLIEPRRSIERPMTPRAEAVAEVRRSLENVTPCVVAQTALV